MSGPVDPVDAARRDDPVAGVEAREGRSATVGGLPVQRVLPTKGRRTVGAWCFVDLMGPMDAEDPDPMEVGPHPHIGLSTVTWLLEGEALHTDSLGSEQVIRPGQLNLMTAGHGIAHAELAARPPFRGAQMWVAQPEGTRHGGNGFEHHGDLPRAELGDSEALVLVGELAGARSTARADTPLLGAQLTLRGGPVELEVASGFEHCVVPLDGRLRVGDDLVEPGWLGLVSPGVDALRIEAEEDGQRMLLLGGEPLGEAVQMWWNFVARSRDELEQAWRDWSGGNTDRFADVASSLQRIDAPTPPWVTQA